MTLNEYEKIYTTPLAHDHIQRLLHSLGIPYSYNIYSKICDPLEDDRCYKVCRNYFVTSADEKAIKHLCELGFMKEIRPCYFVVTKAGVLWLQFNLQLEIQFRDFEDVYD